jgi:hypothetical protein
MQKEMNKLFDTTTEQLDAQTDLSKQRVKASMKQLLAVKKNNSAHVPEPTQTPHKQNVHDEPEESAFNIDDWDVEYDQEK